MVLVSSRGGSVAVLSWIADPAACDCGLHGLHHGLERSNDTRTAHTLVCDCSGDYVWLSVKGRRESISGQKPFILGVGRVYDRQQTSADSYGMHGLYSPLF